MKIINEITTIEAKCTICRSDLEIEFEDVKLEAIGDRICWECPVCFTDMIMTDPPPHWVNMVHSQTED